MTILPRILTNPAQTAFRSYPVVTITGPRQSGKTTLARAAFADKPYANLENPVTREFAEQDPVGFLNQFPDGAVIDEIQRVPGLLSFIQVIVDERQQNSLFPDRLLWPSLLIYAGETEQLRQGIQVLRVSSLSRHLDSLPSVP